MCKGEGYHFKKDIKIGDKIIVNPKYLDNAISLFNEVGLKLGQVLWRKLLPKELEKADILLIRLLYDILVKEKWNLSKIIGDFSINLPKLHSDENSRILWINCAQAYKWSGNSSKAKEIIDEVDWTSCSDEFKLSENVIKNNFKIAAGLMIKLGKKGS